MSEINIKTEFNEAVKSPKRILAMFLMIFIAVTVSLGPLLLRSMEGADVWQILFYRSISWLAALVVIFLFKYRHKVFSNIYAIGKWGIIAGLLIASAQVTFIQALSHITVANTTFVLSSGPFLTALIAFLFLKEKIKTFTALMMLVAAFGIFIMVYQGVSSGNGYGNFMAILTLLGFASFPVILRKFRHIDMLPTMLVPAIIIGLVGIYVKGFDLTISNNDMILCFVWGGVINGFAHTLFVSVSRKLLAAEITLFMMLEFILGPIWVWGFVGEIPTNETLLGGLLVISALFMIVLLELFNNKESHKSYSLETDQSQKRFLSKEEIDMAVNTINESNRSSNEFVKTKDEIERLIRKDIKSWVENQVSKNFKSSLDEYFKQNNRK